MKIMHCCLSCFYIDNYNYQENMLVREHVRAGHDVQVLASTENYDQNGRLTYSKPIRYYGSDGAEVIRLPYRKLLPHILMKKIRAYPGVYQRLKDFQPDVILFHGASAWELLTVVRYKKNHPWVRLYLDNHADFNNSTNGFFSKNILHRLFYRQIFRKSIAYLEKVLCISIESMSFMSKFYGCPDDKAEYFPLGGIIFDDSEYEKNRASLRNKYGLKNNELLFIQSGKFDRKKKLADALRAFLSLPKENNVRYLVAGVLQDDVKDEVERLVAQDERIVFLGWKSAEELLHLLCASDVYVQPGSQSATLQNSICCRCAVIVDDVPSHYPFVRGNGWMVTSSESLVQAIDNAIHAYLNGDELASMCVHSLSIARRLLDYKKLAQRVTL